MNMLIGALVASLVIGNTPIPNETGENPTNGSNNSQIIVFEQTEEEKLAEEQRKIDEERRAEELRLEEERKNSEYLNFDFDIASYTTMYSVNKTNENRNYNMLLASEAIDGVILNPGDTFSYNDTILSKRTPDRDYVDAGVISDGKIVDAIGGGICQISSTLYNAALYSNMTITKRRNHSLMVGYVPAGRDATASWGSIDFCFRNDLEVPVKIESKIGDGKLKIRFLSPKNPNIGDIKLMTEKKDNIYYLYRYVNGKIDYVAKSIYKEKN